MAVAAVPQAAARTLSVEIVVIGAAIAKSLA
jgi:hypothetical protein